MRCAGRARQDDNAAVAEPEQRVPVHRLDLRIDVLDWAYGVAGFEAVSILVDGREMLAKVGAQGLFTSGGGLGMARWRKTAVLCERLCVFIWLNWCNRVRLRSSIGNCPPVE